MLFDSGTFELLCHAIKFIHKVRVADFGLIADWCLKWVLFVVFGVGVIGMIDVVFFFAVGQTDEFVLIE